MENEYEIGLFLEGGASGRTMREIKDNDIASGVASGVVYMTPEKEDQPTIVVAVGPRVSDTDKSMRAVMKRANNIRNAFEAIAKRLYNGEKMSSTPRIYDKEGRVYDLVDSGIHVERVKTLCMEHMDEDLRDNTLFFLPRPDQEEINEHETKGKEAPVFSPIPSQPSKPKRFIVPSNGPEMTLTVFRIHV